jgi:hypothetical protein
MRQYRVDVGVHRPVHVAQIARGEGHGLIGLNTCGLGLRSSRFYPGYGLTVCLVSASGFAVAGGFFAAFATTVSTTVVPATTVSAAVSSTITAAIATTIAIIGKGRISAEKFKGRHGRAQNQRSNTKNSNYLLGMEHGLFLAYESSAERLKPFIWQFCGHIKEDEFDGRNRIKPA